MASALDEAWPMAVARARGSQASVDRDGCGGCEAVVCGSGELEVDVQRGKRDLNDGVEAARAVQWPILATTS